MLFGDGIYIHKNGDNTDNRKCNIVKAKGFKNNGKTNLNGYIAIYMPEHNRAFENGCVYEHILIAEQILHRPLKPEECVHHKDFNRTNNSQENLIVFTNNSEHIYFHKHPNTSLCQQEDGSYMCIKQESENNENQMLCPICRTNLKEKKAKMCIICRNKHKCEHIPSRDDLIVLLCEKSFIEVGKIFGVSDNAIRKWCKKYGLPTNRKEILLLR